MAKWEIAVAVRDEEDLASGHKRKKEGDIIAIVPYPHNWGRKEVKNHLILVVDNLSEEEVNKLNCPHYADGSFSEIFDMDGDFPIWEAEKEYVYLKTDDTTTRDTINESDKIFIVNDIGTGTSSESKPDFSSCEIGQTILDNNFYWKCEMNVQFKKRENLKAFLTNDKIKINDKFYKALNDGTTAETLPIFPDKIDETVMDGTVEWTYIGMQNPQKLGKRKFQFDFNIIKNGWKNDLNLNKVRDINDEYQPMKEITIDMSEEVSIIKDKHKGSFKFSKMKE